ncbi:MAG TPA: hypothetical protein VFY96_00800 [Candidatus Binatia bacterium]|nr:hypothetical protein [Candidatus Binatia bacterium]
MISVLAIAVSTTAAPQISREQGNSFARKVDEINQNATAKLATPKRTAMTEAEVNSYLAFNIKEKIPRGLTEPHVRLLGNGQLAGRVLVDMDDFKRGRTSGGMLDPLSYIAGQVPVTARGVLSTRDGKGQFQLIAAEMNGYPLPKPFVQELVRYFSRTPTNPNGFNLEEPFLLPAKIREITVNAAEAVVVQ